MGSDISALDHQTVLNAARASNTPIGSVAADLGELAVEVGSETNPLTAPIGAIKAARKARDLVRSHLSSSQTSTFDQISDPFGTLLGTRTTNADIATGDDGDNDDDDDDADSQTVAPSYPPATNTVPVTATVPHPNGYDHGYSTEHGIPPHYTSELPDTSIPPFEHLTSGLGRADMYLGQAEQFLNRRVYDTHIERIEHPELYKFNPPQVIADAHLPWTFSAAPRSDTQLATTYRSATGAPLSVVPTNFGQDVANQDLFTNHSFGTSMHPDANFGAHATIYHGTDSLALL